MKLESATFGGGCFWCVEAVVQRLNGVLRVESGYMGGTVPGTPTFREVCSGLTGHAESVKIEFDADVLSYRNLLSVFMTSHDPTQLNKQGADRGTQYRSVVFYHSKEQKDIAEQVFEELQAYYEDPIVTELTEASRFHIAEIDHQNYYNENPDAGYCRVVIDPKISKLKAMYADLLK